ncbi:MAG: thioredoxin domain-containing protein [Mailhella sp.]|nr:thioredoxin domain-containing protein [Mailhella sp.]
MIRHAIQSLICAFTLAAPAFAADQPYEEREFADKLRKVLSENPDIVMNVLRENSAELFSVVQGGAEAQRHLQLNEQWENDVLTHKKYSQTGRPAIGAEVGAAVTVVAYSDLTCTYCRQASKTISALLKNHPEVRFIFKSNPNGDVGRHASRWFYEAYRMDPVKAWKLHNAFFERQEDYKNDPMGTVKELAASCGLDADKLEKSVYDHLKALDGMIDKDKEEAESFGFSGTPYFLVNDLVLRGALPLASFEDALDFAAKYKRAPGK